MLRAKEGDRESFDVIVRSSRTAVFHYLYRMVRNQEIAEDLTQETFLRAYRGRTLYKPVARFETWLYRIATNVAINHLRAQRLYRHNITGHSAAFLSCCREAPDPRPNAEIVLARDERRQKVRAAVACLPERQRFAVLLHKYHGMDYDDIANTLGCSLQAVKSLLFRAYERLRSELALV